MPKSFDIVTDYTAMFVSNERLIGSENLFQHFSLALIFGVNHFKLAHNSTDILLEYFNLNFKKSQLCLIESNNLLTL